MTKKESDQSARVDTRGVMMAAVTGMLRKAGYEFRKRHKSEKPADLYVLPYINFPLGLFIVVRTQTVSGSTEQKARELRDIIESKRFADTPVMFVIDGLRSSVIREIVGTAQATGYFICSLNELLLWIKEGGQPIHEQMRLFQ